MSDGTAPQSSPLHARLSDELESALVGGEPAEPVHQQVVVNAVEEFRQVHVDRHPIAFLDIALNLAHGPVGIAPRSKAAAGLGEGRVDEGG